MSSGAVAARSASIGWTLARTSDPKTRTTSGTGRRNRSASGANKAATIASARAAIERSSKLCGSPKRSQMCIRDSAHQTGEDEVGRLAEDLRADRAEHDRQHDQDDDRGHFEPFGRQPCLLSTPRCV